MESMNKQKVNVLVPVRNVIMSLAITTLPRGVANKYSFHFATKCSNKSFLDRVEECKEIIRKKNISVVLATQDLGDLIGAAVARDFSHLSGPSVESCFLAHHKFYTRMHLDIDPIPYAHIALDNPGLRSDFEAILDHVGTPAFLKPVSGVLSEGVTKVDTVDALLQAVESCRGFGVFKDVESQATTDSQYFSEFYRRYVDSKKYPLATVPGALLEAHIDAPIIAVDGCVCEREIIHWEITDNIFWKSNPGCYIGCAIPSTLPQDIQQKAWQYYDLVVQKLIDYGFNNHFVDVEFFVLSNGELKLLEVNTRLCIMTIPYRQCLMHGDQIEAQIKLAQRIRPETPVPTGMHGLYAFFYTSATGQASELLNYSVPGVIPSQAPGDYIGGNGLKLIAVMMIYGTSRDKVIKEFKDVYHRLLLKPEYSPWDF